MAKIDFYVPEPSEVYNKDTQRQIIQALDTLKTQLNTSYNEEVREDLQTLSWFLIGTGRKNNVVNINNFTASITGSQLAIAVASVTVVTT
jgi:hypothetical protein